MHRRSYLAGVWVAVAGSLAGCAARDDEPENCRLVHELVASGTPGSPAETYEYEDLGPDAQAAFDAAREEGSYAITDAEQAPEAFRYWDETTTYEVVYQNETYTLRTYSGAGCEPDA